MKQAYFAVTVELTRMDVYDIADELVDDMLMNYSDEAITLSALDREEFVQAVMQTPVFLRQLTRVIRGHGLEVEAAVDYFDMDAIHADPNISRVIEVLEYMYEIHYEAEHHRVVTPELEQAAELLRGAGYRVSM